MMAWLLVSIALAGERVVVRPGDTVDSLAGSDAAMAAEIRRLNGLGASGNPPVGALLELPTDGGAPQESEVISLEGHGTATLPGEAPVPLEAGLRLPVGSQVCTDAESFATIRLARDLDSYNHDDISLLSSTCLTVVGAAARPGRRSSVIAITEGGVSVVGAEDSPGDVIVQTPIATTTGDAGGFRVTLEPGAARTEAVSAPVEVYAQGEELHLDSGQATRVKIGEAPQQARGLLRGAALFLPEDGASLRWPDFRWQGVSRALGYRVQIATSPEFNEILAQVDVPFPEWSPDYLLLPVAVPAYWWRVAPLDRFGFEGVPSAPRRVAVPAGVSQ